MEIIQETKREIRGNGYQRCLIKAIDRTGELLREEDAVFDCERIHSVKSILYAAIEQAGIESDRLISAQELLRELLMFVALQGDPVQGERKEARKILGELRSQYSYL